MGQGRAQKGAPSSPHVITINPHHLWHQEQLTRWEEEEETLLAPPRPLDEKPATTTMMMMTGTIFSPSPAFR